MAPRKNTGSPTATPSLTPADAITVLKRQRERGNQIAAAPTVDTDQLTTWGNTTHELLVRALGVPNATVERFLSAARWYVAPNDEAGWQRHYRGSLETQLRLVDSALELLEVEVSPVATEDIVPIPLGPAPRIEPEEAHVRRADRQLLIEVRALIDESAALRGTSGPGDQRFDSWFSRAEHVVGLVGQRGVVFAQRIRAAQEEQRYRVRAEAVLQQRRGVPLIVSPVYRWMIESTAGTLDGFARAIESGLLTEVEDRVAAEIYGDVLAEAEMLLNANHLACAAILTRAGLESGLKRRARRDNMPGVETAKVSVVNDWLWKNSVYHKQSHDSVEGWLAPGNAFAHSLPEREKYTHRDIATTLRDVRSFVGTLLT
jgi:hypothetical protein